MAESKIDFSFENFHFACEGEQDWVEYQLNQMLNRIQGLNKSELFAKFENGKPVSGQDGIDQKLPQTLKKENIRRGRKLKGADTSDVPDNQGDPLLSFLRDKNAEKNQVKKFLATAVFLHSQGVEKFSTPMVSKLLKSAHIEKLINASDCLNKNEKKGFCIKDEKEFILTDSGIRSIVGGSQE